MPSAAAVDKLLHDLLDSSDEEEPCCTPLVQPDSSLQVPPELSSSKAASADGAAAALAAVPSAAPLAAPAAVFDLLSGDHEVQQDARGGAGGSNASGSTATWAATAEAAVGSLPGLPSHAAVAATTTRGDGMGSGGIAEGEGDDASDSGGLSDVSTDAAASDADEQLEAEADGEQQQWWQAAQQEAVQQQQAVQRDQAERQLQRLQVACEPAPAAASPLDTAAVEHPSMPAADRHHAAAARPLCPPQHTSLLPQQAEAAAVAADVPQPQRALAGVGVANADADADAGGERQQLFDRLVASGTELSIIQCASRAVGEGERCCWWRALLFPARSRCLRESPLSDG